MSEKEEEERARSKQVARHVVHAGAHDGRVQLSERASQA